VVPEYDNEFSFELQVCQWAEEHWRPERRLPSDQTVLVARQLGTKRRRWDTIVLEVDQDGLAARADFGEKRLDDDLLDVVLHAPADWEWYRDALPEPDYPWRYVREAVHRAGDRGAIEKRERNNRIELRRKHDYPDWVERIVAIENKPDLDASAAAALQDQIERDVALGLADEVWVATAATGDPVEPALLERLPVEAGIVTVAERESSVTWHPHALPPDEPGTRIVERPAGGRHDASAARFEYVDPEWKARKRLVLAERAYERGWRSYAESMRPDCRHFQLRQGPHGPLPWCAEKSCHQSSAACSYRCDAFEPEPPAWRQYGWPIEGGPGKAIKDVLDRRRDSQRPER
jgi:hypothetical protein